MIQYLGKTLHTVISSVRVCWRTAKQTGSNERIAAWIEKGLLEQQFEPYDTESPTLRW